MHVTTTFSLKQGETRTSSGPISYPLIISLKRTFHYNLLKENAYLIFTKKITGSLLALFLIQGVENYVDTKSNSSINVISETLINQLLFNHRRKNMM